MASIAGSKCGIEEEKPTSIQEDKMASVAGSKCGIEEAEESE